MDVPFGQNISFFVAGEPHVRGNPAEGDKISMGMKVTKKMLHFQNLGKVYIKSLKGLQGISGVRVKDERRTFVERNARKGEENRT